ncbi:MAG: glycoside hydrolase family 97 catalytic domain-containing protein [Pirellulales bacterium]
MWGGRIPFLKKSIAAVALLNLVLSASAQQSNEALTVDSPNGRIRIELSIDPTDGSQHQLRYQVFLNERQVVEPSNLGVELAQHETLGHDCELISRDSRSIDTSFEQFPGKRSHVVERCNETSFTFRERSGAKREWKLVVRAYDDGVAWRYHFPAEPGWSQLEVAEDLTEFHFPAGATATWLPLTGFVTSHENYYRREPIEKISSEGFIGLPLLVEFPGPVWAAVLEANLTDYAGLYLAKSSGDGNKLSARLSPLPDKSGLAVRATLPHDSPWRVILLSDRLETLIDSDLALTLNAPSTIADTSWIKPGKTTFPWWNDYYEDPAAINFPLGLNTATAKYYTDFCAEHGIPYYSLDGVNDTAWYGGPIVPYQGADITKAIDGLDLPAVIAYAKEKGVRLRLWMHWEAARQHMARAFPLYRQWGIEGVMIDFMDRDDQEMVNFQRELLQLAAENQLTVTLHGVAPPTGLERTFPNLLNSEAVMNLEYDKWNEAGIPPEHDVAVAMTRMLAGPLDYHQGTLRGVPLEEFKPRNRAPLVIGTPCRMLATYVVFQNHLPMMADYPSAYRGHPLTKVMTSIPATWDETRALAAKPDEVVAIARRSGDDWWIGALGGRASRDIALPLKFLGDGKFQADIYTDDLSAQYRFRQLSQSVAADEKLTLQLAPAGGALVRLRPAKPSPPGWRLVWEDDFNSFDDSKWQRIATDKPTNNSLQAYLKEQVSVDDGKLVLLSEDKPAGKLKYRSGQVKSKQSWLRGRFEVRAKIPGTRGMWPAIWLLPDGPWPSEGEIDIMENRGNQPTITSSAFHWGAVAPFKHDFFTAEQQTSIAGKPVHYPDGFHTFAVEWLPDQLRFYVDDVYHTIFYNDECGYVLPKLDAPMRLVINTAIGGDFLPPPDATTEWPQRFEVDWVRVYERDEASEERTFVNGDFEAGGGSLAGWHVFGNRTGAEANVLVHREVVKDGDASLKLSGQMSGGENYSGVTQGISVRGGDRVRARLGAFVRSQEPLDGSRNRVYMKIEFYSHWAEYFGGPAMLDVKEKLIADADTPVDQWLERELTAVAPAGAVEARLSLVFAQAADERGAIHIDDVDFTRERD